MSVCLQVKILPHSKVTQCYPMVTQDYLKLPIVPHCSTRLPSLHTVPWACMQLHNLFFSVNENSKVSEHVEWYPQLSHTITTWPWLPSWQRWTWTAWWTRSGFLTCSTGASESPPIGRTMDGKFGKEPLKSLDLNQMSCQVVFFHQRHFFLVLILEYIRMVTSLSILQITNDMTIFSLKIQGVSL